tara:strand:+ start:961 stop:1524 length:564 start_codon:yes stop_codon:yes gene_type:complete
MFEINNINKIQNQIQIQNQKYNNDLLLAIKLSRIEEENNMIKLHNKYNNKNKIPKKYKNSAIINDLNTNKLFYTYCNKVHNKFAILFINCINDIYNNKYFSLNKEMFNLTILTSNSFKNQIKNIYNNIDGKNYYILKEIVNNFSIKYNIKKTPMMIDIIYHFIISIYPILNNLLHHNYLWKILYSFL